MNLSKEDLIAIAGIIDTKLEPIHDDIRDLKEDVSELKEDVSGLKKDVSGLKEDVSGLQKDNKSLKHNLLSVRLNQENTIIPRLNTIESCYSDTHHRYIEGIDQIEQLQQDVDILKRTVALHSQKLSALA